ncbi:hypothetical protein [Methylobacterium sp. CM6246]
MFLTINRSGAHRGRRRTKAKQLSPLYRGREHRVVRWIGAAKRRMSKSAQVTVIEVVGAPIIRLSWAETHGRLVRSELPWLARTIDIDAPVPMLEAQGDLRRIGAMTAMSVLNG